MRIINGILSNVEKKDLVNGHFQTPRGVVKIGSYAFYNCKDVLKTVKLTNDIVKIGNYAFYECHNLKLITQTQNIKEIGNYAFDGCSKLRILNFPKNISKIGISAFQGCNRLSKIVLSDKIKVIEDFTFCNCRNLKTIVITAPIVKINDYVFYDCKKLKDVIIKNKISKIGNSSFKNCIRLKNISTLDKIETIGNSVFNKCSSLKSIDLGNTDTIEEIGKEVLKESTITKVKTYYGDFKKNNLKQEIDLLDIYLYLYSNSILKNKYQSIEDFTNNKYINELLKNNKYIDNKDIIHKFKKLFYKLRQTYNIPSSLFCNLTDNTIEKLKYKIWNNIKDIFEYENSLELSKSLNEIIYVFGLFEKDEYRNDRLKYLKYLFTEREIILSEQDYDKLEENLKTKFYKIYKPCYYLMNNYNIPYEFNMYLKQKLTEDDLKTIKKITGTFGKRLNDYVKNNYFSKYDEEYKLKVSYSENQDIRKKLFKYEINGTINKYNLHRIFDGFDENYNDDFFKFFCRNFDIILNNPKFQGKLKEISKRFDKISKYYLINSGVEDITIKQAVDYLENQIFEYEPGNYEFNLAAKRAGVTDNKAFEYYQQIYKKNDTRKLYSLIRRSNTYDINGYIIKGELLRKDDSFGMLVGETNYTNCCQIYGGMGHNCMAHAVNSDDGGIFVTRLLKDGEWILLTQSWDWQNNNVYCHDNVEATPYFKNSSKSLKQAVSEVFKQDALKIIKESNQEIVKYINAKKRYVNKYSLLDRKHNLEELNRLKEKEIIKVVTIGEGNDDLGLGDYFTKRINVNTQNFKNKYNYTLSNFQPINYNEKQLYFNPKKTAYTDSRVNQWVIGGSIENLYIKDQQPLKPIYRDERRIVKESNSEIRDYTINKIIQIGLNSKINDIPIYQELKNYDFYKMKIILGEDWYLIYKQHSDKEISLIDINKTDPSIPDETSIQIKEMLSEFHGLINKYDKINIKLKEDKIYLLFLLNKKIENAEQIKNDIKYNYNDDIKSINLNKKNTYITKNYDNLSIHSLSFNKILKKTYSNIKKDEN